MSKCVQSVEFSGVPSFFSAACRDASNANINRMRIGYDHPGEQLGGSILSHVPHCIERDDEWGDIISDELLPLIDSEDCNGVINWLAERMPNCIALVPKRRRLLFATGFIRGVRDSGSFIF